jgi:hypothetical protein
MPDRVGQIQPPDVHIDFGALGDAVWHSFINQLPTVGQAVWTPLSEWLQAGIHNSADALWANAYVAIGSMLFQLPPMLTYRLPAYQAIATNPVPVAVGGATLALVLLGLRTLFGAMVGRDNVIAHVTGRLIPAAGACVGYTVLVTWTVDHINEIAAAVGGAAFNGFLAFPTAPNPALLIPYVVLWLLLIFYTLKLLIRVAYSLFRFLVALVFGPVAIILWAIPQTEWVTSFWVREFIGWGTTPLLVAVALSLAIPLAIGQAGFLGAALFGIAGLKAAADLAGLFAMSKGGGGGGIGVSVIGLARLAAGAATGGAGAAASIPANRVTTLADSYGYQ